MMSSTTKTALVMDTSVSLHQVVSRGSDQIIAALAPRAEAGINDVDGISKEINQHTIVSNDEEAQKEESENETPKTTENTLLSGKLISAAEFDDDSFFCTDDKNDENHNRVDDQQDLDSKSSTTEHLGNTRQYWRDIILGVNDGLVSTFLLVAGVSGGGMKSTEILLTAIAGAIAGAVSMCAGEYVATKSQNEVMQGEIELEKRHIQVYNRDELMEVRKLLERIGIKEKGLQKQIIYHYQRDPQALLKIMIALELGVLEDGERSPIRAGLFSCVLFLIGASPSVLPFVIPDIDPVMGLIIAAVATAVGLIAVGIAKTWATRGNCVSAALENLCIAGFGGGFAYVVGMIFEKIV